MKPEVMKKILSELERKDCVLIAAYQLQHPSDHYLQLVMIKRDEVHQPYVTWMHNSDCGGFHNGHYLDSIEEAKADFFERTLGK